MKRSKIFLLSAMTAIAALTLNSCSKDSSPTNPTGTDFDKVKTAKITVKVTGLDNNDAASVILVAGESSGNTAVWKMNGTALNNESNITLNEQDLSSGQTYVMETTKPVMQINADYSCLNSNLSGTAPIVFYYKAEINGKVENEVTKTLTADGESASQDFVYKGD